MKAPDRFLQNWRINKALPYVVSRGRVLDIGCADATFFRVARKCKELKSYVGVDPDLSPETQPFDPRMQLVKGTFPESLENAPDGSFDSIVMLACLEHIPESVHPTLARHCFRLLGTDGTLVITVPDHKVDYILDVLKAMKLIDGMETGQHYHYDIRLTPNVFQSSGLNLLVHKKFQLGLNNLFVFRKSNRV